MNRKYLICRKICGVAFVALTSIFFHSCADAYTDKETFVSSVQNQVLQSPLSDSIRISKSTDGSTFSFTWPVVYGASGYSFTLYNVDDPNNPVVVGTANDTIDGCSATRGREEETNYKIVLKTLGNATYKNKDAEKATEKVFSTSAPSFAVIPDGSDISEWFKNNPIPADSINAELIYALVPGGTYTMTDAIDFGGQKVVVKGGKIAHSKISMTGSNSCFKTSNGFNLKFVDVDCSGSTAAALICLSPTPSSTLKVTGGYSLIEDPLVLMDCNIDNLSGGIIYDNKVKYCVKTMLVNNCKMHLTSSKALSSTAHFYFNQGFINDLTVKKSTLWNTGESDAKYFVQYNNSGRCDRAGYTSNSVNFSNCTFYKICYAGQWGNYGGFVGRTTSYWDMEKCIFVDCGGNQIARRFLGGRTNQTTATFAYNTYMYGTAFESVTGYDNSGTNIEADPQFKDAANGDFTISGNLQITNKTGDPRWLPATE